MSGRIVQHPILEFDSAKKRVTITVDGKKIQAVEGEPIAAAVLANGIRVFRYTAKYHRPRGVFCAVGRCTDCIMTVNGVPGVRTCITAVEDGMVIESKET